ncbi:hypothetical protein G4Y79_03630 [Phototrophicus methaneseepsis]|uniref:DUF6754 domain-containing protein n=1 Tax=Phototrophicus methaneseepsis TaxID=2710758 RepID=A0A7S8EAN7_9CHLR|nr:DUF6754 domain-containing protein [Phototrophicus methaneseepsis]QPC83485.1 hypothetical protein G4Y79_03630 [Phototrophicus methaneseepsis]
MASDVQVITIIIIVVTFAVSLIVRRRKPAPLRPISAYSVLPTLAGESIESSRPLHIGFGGASLGDENTMLALVAAEAAYYAIQPATIGDIAPILTTSETSTIPLAVDTLRRAYASRHMLASYTSTNVRWYPAGPRALAYSGALTTLAGDDRINSHVLVGRYGVELSLVLASAGRRGLTTIATSSTLEGQAVAYAMADHALIGDEIFGGAAYLSGSAHLANRNLTIDLLRWALIIAMLLLLAANLAQQYSA